MTITQALQAASAQVSIIHYNTHQYEVQVWSRDHKAWRQGQVQRRERALHDAWEAKVERALELLGVADAGALANGAVYNDYPHDWRDVVRTLYRKHKSEN